MTLGTASLRHPAVKPPTGARINGSLKLTWVLTPHVASLRALLVRNAA